MAKGNEVTLYEARPEPDYNTDNRSIYYTGRIEVKEMQARETDKSYIVSETFGGRTYQTRIGKGRVDISLTKKEAVERLIEEHTGRLKRAQKEVDNCFAILEGATKLLRSLQEEEE